MTRRDETRLGTGGSRWVGLTLLVALAGLLGGGSPVAAQVIKLATLAPDGSLWHKELKEMGEAWQEASGGAVSLRIYPGGVAGDESDMVRKMRIGQLHAASLSVIGLADIDEAFNGFQIPFFFDSWEELYQVLDELQPELAKRLEAKGFVLLGWGHGGWVHLFSSKPVRRLDDLKRLDIFTQAGDDRMVQWWKDNGFHPVPLATTDIMTALQTGMIEALAVPPLAALALQWFRETPYMNDLGLGPLMAATVMTRRAWEGIPEENRDALRAAARRVDEHLRVEVPRQEAEAVEEMKKRGLTVTTNEDPGEWRREAENFAVGARSGSVPADFYDRLVAVRDAVRRGRAREGSR